MLRHKSGQQSIMHKSGVAFSLNNIQTMVCLIYKNLSFCDVWFLMLVTCSGVLTRTCLLFAVDPARTQSERTAEPGWADPHHQSQQPALAPPRLQPHLWCAQVNHFCHAMHQIGYDMKRCIIAEERVIWLKIGTLAIQPLTLHDFFLAIAFFPARTCSKRYDCLRFPPIFKIVTDGIIEGLTLHYIVTTSASWGGAIAVNCKLKIV